MPTELVILSDLQPTTARVALVCEQWYPGGLVIEAPEGGFRQAVDGDGVALASFFDARQIRVRAAVAGAVVGAAEEHVWWTDVTIPYGDATRGRAFADEVAARAGGALRDRS